MFVESKVQRLTLEQHFLDTLSAVYNVSRVARSSEGCTRSAEIRAKMVLALHRDSNRIGLIREWASKPKSEEHKLHISESHLGI